MTSMFRQSVLLSCAVAAAILVSGRSPRAQGQDPKPKVEPKRPQVLLKVTPSSGMVPVRVSGTVELMMKVGEDGTVPPGSFAVMTASRPEFAAAAARVVARMRFAPGRLDGRPVKTWVTIPLTFSAGG